MIKTLFFDLGNVLIDFDHDKMWKEISIVCGVDESSLKEIVMNQNLWRRYEVGLLKSSSFLKEIELGLKKKIDQESFKLKASDIFSENVEMTSLLKDLKKRGYEIFLISNTCDIHFEFIKKKFPIFDQFDGLILSYEVSMRKPSEEIFSYALAKTSSKPEECLFIDDLVEHTNAARSLGMVTHHFSGIDGLRKDLHKLNIPA